MTSFEANPDSPRAEWCAICGAHIRHHSGGVAYFCVDAVIGEPPRAFKHPTRNVRPPRAWSILAAKLGGHWHADVRAGTEGSRGLCGRLAFDLSDADALISELRRAFTQVAETTAYGVIGRLTHAEKVGLMLRVSSLETVEIAALVDQAIMGASEQGITMLRHAFNIVLHGDGGVVIE